MLEKLLSPLTTAKASGVVLRDAIVVVGSIIAILGMLGFLSPEQVEELTRQAPALLTALGTAIVAGMSIYRAVFKSSSDKAAVAAKEIDTKLPVNASVKIETPAGQPDIVVTPAGKVK
ncbi:MAG TPA: hypothetical protein VMF90_03105 [Rhizobiaceae bacterium]|nr:hypothetical protein [Rhizobiaceae bacterium]